MERKQGFFSVIRGLSPSRSRPKSPARSASPMSSLLRRRKAHAPHHEQFLMARSGSMRPVVPEALSPLKEGPDQDGDVGDSSSSRVEGRWGQWVKGPRQLLSSSSIASSSSSSGDKRSDLRLLLGVLGAPLAPVHVSCSEPLPYLSIKDTPIMEKDD